MQVNEHVLFFFLTYFVNVLLVLNITMWTRDILLIKAIEISHFLWYFECTKKKQFVTTRLLACLPLIMLPHKKNQIEWSGRPDYY
jgi:hypothetical protein